MTALHGIVFGGVYLFVMLMATVFLRLLSRAKIFTVTITAKTYLQVSILVALALCVVGLVLEPNQESGPWLFFFLLGFQIIVLVTSYLEPFNRRPAAAER